MLQEVQGMILMKRQVFKGCHSFWPEFEADDAYCTASNDVVHLIALRTLANRYRGHADFTVITSDDLGDEAKAPFDEEHVDIAQPLKSNVSLPRMIDFNCIVVHESVNSIERP
jgi:hypothetical protein